MQVFRFDLHFVIKGSVGQIHNTLHRIRFYVNLEKLNIPTTDTLPLLSGKPTSDEPIL